MVSGGHPVLKHQGESLSSSLTPLPVSLNTKKTSSWVYNEIWQHFYYQCKETRWSEWVSTATQVASVWYVKNNVLVYPTGIIGVLLASMCGFFMVTPPLYADASWIFILSWVCGLVRNCKKQNSEYAYPISWCSKKNCCMAFVFLRCPGPGFIFYSPGSQTAIFPMLDSLVSSSAITGMWWMAEKKIWKLAGGIVSNIIAIPLNFYKELMLFTLMYILFLPWPGKVLLNGKKLKISTWVIAIISLPSKRKQTSCIKFIMIPSTGFPFMMMMNFLQVDTEINQAGLSWTTILKKQEKSIPSFQY